MNLKMTSDLQYQVFFSQKLMNLFKSERKINEDSTVAWKSESMYLLRYGRVLILPQCCAVFRLIGYHVQHTIVSLISSFVEFVEHMNISSSPVKLRDGSKIHPQVFKIKLAVLCQRCCKRKRTYGTQSKLIMVSMYQFDGSVEKQMDLIVTLGHWVLFVIQGVSLLNLDYLKSELFQARVVMLLDFSVIGLGFLV